jgi:hypothetical protein
LRSRQSVKGIGLLQRIYFIGNRKITPSCFYTFLNTVVSFYLKQKTQIGAQLHRVFEYNFTDILLLVRPTFFVIPSFYNKDTIYPSAGKYIRLLLLLLLIMSSSRNRTVSRISSAICRSWNINCRTHRLLSCRLIFDHPFAKFLYLVSASICLIIFIQCKNNIHLQVSLSRQFPIIIRIFN